MAMGLKSDFGEFMLWVVIGSVMHKNGVQKCAC